MISKQLLAMCLGAALCVPAAAQDAASPITVPANQDPASAPSTKSTQTGDGQQQTDTEVTPMDKTPVFRVNVISRTTSAVNYRHRAGSTKIDFRGTSLMPESRGQAEVTGKSSGVEINLDFGRMKPATSFGPEYLTYVLWAITPEGRPVNLGEIVPNDDGEYEMRATSDLQAFGMIVTAEPYFAVTRPSNMIVMENVVRKDTKGWEQPIMARFDLLERGEYTIDLDPTKLPATGQDWRKVPLTLLEARNAVAIARSAGADKYAPDALARAEESLARGEDYLKRKQSRSAIGTVARGAVQAAEDARVLTIRRKQEERIAAERRAQEQQTAEAQQRAQDEAERARQAQEQATQAQQQATTSEQERLAAEEARLRAQAEADRAIQERIAAEQARQQAIEQQQALAQQTQQAQLQTQQAQQAAMRAEQEREQMRARLLTQLNQVLQTRDTARGLIVNMSDVLFDTGKATLRSGAKLRLAKVAGIIMAYPDLRLEIEGHTDSVGSEDYNITLSDRRAAAVRSFLAQQGVPPDRIVSRGYGESQPIASNASSAGRQQNRRVELVVSGQAIETARSREGAGAGASTGAVGTAGGTTGGATGAVGAGGVQGGTSSGTGAVVSPGTIGVGASGTATTPGVSGSAGGTVNTPAGAAGVGTTGTTGTQPSTNQTTTPQQTQPVTPR